MNNLKQKEIFEEVVKYATTDKTIKQYLKHIALLGSVRCDEAIEKYSDLDILFIFDSNKTGAIPINVLEKLKDIGDELSEKSNVEISLLPHTIFDFKEYVDFNYLIHYSWGEVVYGEKDVYKKIFEDIIKEKYSEQKRKDLIYYNLIHARFNLIRKYISWNKNNKGDYNNTILKLFIDNLVEICDWALVYKNIFEKNKKDVAKKFIEEYPELKHNKAINKALEIRFNWDNEDLKMKNDEFLNESIFLIDEIIESVYEKYKEN